MVEIKLSPKFKSIEDFLSSKDENNHRVKAFMEYFEAQKKNTLTEKQKLSLLENYINVKVLNFPKDDDLLSIKTFIDGQIIS